MNVITTPLGFLGLFAIVFLGFLFYNLSRRLGAVTKMREYHNWFAVASGLVAVAAMSHLIRGSAALACDPPPVLLQPWFALVSFHVPLAAGVVLDLVLVWYYWGWILKEHIE